MADWIDFESYPTACLSCIVALSKAHDIQQVSYQVFLSLYPFFYIVITLISNFPTKQSPDVCV